MHRISIAQSARSKDRRTLVVEWQGKRLISRLDQKFSKYLPFRAKTNVLQTAVGFRFRSVG